MLTRLLVSLPLPIQLIYSCLLFCERPKQDGDQKLIHLLILKNGLEADGRVSFKSPDRRFSGGSH